MFGVLNIINIGTFWKQPESVFYDAVVISKLRIRLVDLVKGYILLVTVNTIGAVLECLSDYVMNPTPISDLSIS